MNAVYEAFMQVCKENKIDPEEAMQKVPVFKEIVGAKDDSTTEGLTKLCFYLLSENHKLKDKLEMLKKNDNP